MAYTPKTWRDYPSTETMVMASDMNRIEQGIKNAHDTLDKKANADDIKEIAYTGKDEDVTFDNTDTDFEATNVHDAIIEAAEKGDIPTKLSDLADDSTHRLVTDTEKESWNAKAKESIVSDKFDIDKTYTAKDMFISGDTIYKVKDSITSISGTQPPNDTYYEPTNLGTELSALNSNLAHDLLWENPNWSASGNLPSFDAQTISLDLSKYKYVEIELIEYDRVFLDTFKFRIDSNIGKNRMTIAGANLTSGYQTSTTYRAVVVRDNGLTFENCIYSHNNTAATQNLYMIPIRIYGVNY